MALKRETTTNRILARLPAEDFALLRPALSAVELPLRRQLEIRNRDIEHVYFLERGLASVVISAGSAHSIEVGIIGNEGMTGFPILLDCDYSLHETFIQSAGSGWRITTADFRSALEQSASLHRLLLRYAHTMFTQMAFTALANGRYKIEERLARWLLMAEDRAEGEQIKLTHEFLAVMLGTRRPGVTNALNLLEKRGVIENARGTIRITDRSALMESANGSYGGPEAEYKRLFGERA